MSAAGGDPNAGGGNTRAATAPNGGGVAVTPVPLLPVGQTTWFGRAISWLKGEVSTGWAAVTDFMEHEALPFLETFLKQTALDEIQALKPLAIEAAQAVVTDIPKLFTEPGAFLGAVTATAQSTLQKAEAVGLQVAQASVITTAQAAVQNLMAAHAAGNAPGG